MSNNTKLDLVVVLPVSRMDWHLAVHWLRWVSYLHDAQDCYTMQEESSGTGPLVLDEFGVAYFHGLHVVVLCSPNLSDSERSMLRKATLRIDPEDADFAKIAIAKDIQEIGYFGSPNQMFKAALDLMEKDYPGRAMLWAEADTVPMTQNWFKNIRAEYRACGKPFMGDVHRCEIDHMTGNAVYHPDWRKLAPSLALLPGPVEIQGWDSQCAHETLPQAHLCTTIKQIWRPKQINREFIDSIPDGVELFHQDKSGKMIDLLCDSAQQLRFGMYDQLEKATYDSIAFLSPYRDWPATAPKVSILFVTFWRDIEYMKYSVRSIERFCRGFHSIVVCVPRAENDGRWETVLPKGFTIHYYDEVKGKGMVQHLMMKCHADELCTGADFVLHLDPDCMFLTDTDPGDFLTAVDVPLSGAPGGKMLVTMRVYKPTIVAEKYSKLKNTNRQYWQVAVKHATGLVPEWETMVRHPQVYRVDLYAALRELVVSKWGATFDQYVMAQQNHFPQGFAEFPSLGALALAKFSEAYILKPYDRDVDAVECGQDPSLNWQYIYRPGRDHVVEFYSLHDVRIYWPAMDGILARKLEKFYVK